MKTRRVGAFLFVSGAIASAMACESTPQPVDHRVIVSLVTILARPDEMPTPQPIQVRGFLSSEMTWLYLTSEHAASEDILSAISVSPPSEGFITGPCTERFVEVWGTLMRSSSGSLFIRDIEKVTIPKRLPKSPRSLREIIPEQCWP